MIGALLALAAGPFFTLGVNAGEIQPNSAFLWAHASRPGSVKVEVARDAGFRRMVVGRTAHALASADNTIHIRIAGFRPGRHYFYRFVHGNQKSAVGRFETAPQPARSAPVRFAFSGDADATPAPGTRTPFYNHFEVYARMAAEHNDFNINLGDTIYSDSEVPNTPAALTLDAKRVKYRLNLSLPALQRLRAATGLYSHWDDHEFINDFSREEFPDVYAAGVRAFRDYAPVTYTASDGLFRTFRWGRNLELFFLDERSFRSAKATAGGVCNGPNGSPDLAPTAPQPVRNAFAALIPSLANPPPPGCIARINDPSRTMLGTRQYDRFTAAIAKANVTFKVVVNEVPIQQFYALPYDRWEGYAAEREKLLRFLQANAGHVVFLTTDTHATMINDARLQTLEPGGPIVSGITEVVTGPVATMTFAKEIDSAVRSSGAGVLISGLFFKRAPPSGVGMKCVSPDTYSYAEVVVTSSTLTITPNDAQGSPVKDVSGQPCQPVVIHAG